MKAIFTIPIQQIAVYQKKTQIKRKQEVNFGWYLAHSFRPKKGKGAAVLLACFAKKKMDEMLDK